MESFEQNSLESYITVPSPENDQHSESDGSNSSESDEKKIHIQAQRILSEHNPNENLVIKMTRESGNDKREVKKSCKVIHFSSEWNFDEVSVALDELKPTEYPNLLIFIIEVEKIGFRAAKRVKKLKENLIKFCVIRPLILQLTSTSENVTKFYFKEENSTQFITLDKQQTNFEELENFQSFLCSFFYGKPEDFEKILIKSVQWILNSPLVLKFLRIFEDPFKKVILEVARKGTKSDFLTILDASSEGSEGILSIEMQNYLSELFYDGQSNYKQNRDIEAENNIPLDVLSQQQNDNSSQRSHAEADKDLACDSDHVCSSVLQTAIENKNTEVNDYLITYWTHLIQQLPFEHQVRISSKAFETNQHDVLCDLLEIADFPFPENFEFGEEQGHERLRSIIMERIQLKSAIKVENFDRINDIINKNLSLRVLYNLDNKSTMKHAIDLKKYKVYFHLKSLGFKATEFENLEDALTGKDLKEANQCRMQQRRKNVNEALVDDQKSINLLCNRSLIHNRRISNEQEAEYRRKIREWYTDINMMKFGAEFLNTVASCDHLKIIYDFESDTVERASLSGPNVLGSMYSFSKWIFIGAKLSDADVNERKKREQQIKGVLAHELCHYVMRLVYENQENPYYKHRKDIREMFEEIANDIDKWSTEDSKCPDDECSEIISSVFELYSEEEFHLELIVRVVQILVEFDDNEEKLKYLQEKYKILFDYWELQVIPELHRYLCRNKEVIKLNGIIGLLPNILKKKYDLEIEKDIKSLLQNKLVIVATNVSTLLFTNIHKYLQAKCGNLLDSQNVFTDPEKFTNVQIWNDFKQTCSHIKELNIFVDCTNGVPEYLRHIFVNKEANFIFVVQNESQSKELTKIFAKVDLKNQLKMIINYNWSDLAVQSQKLLLQTKINFQNNSQLSLMDVLKNEVRVRVNSEEPASNKSEESEKQITSEDFSEIICEQTLKLLVEKSQIYINSNASNDKHGKIFELLFQSRNFLKKGESKAENRTSESKKKLEEFSLEQLLTASEGKRYILLSDKAGNGKSWVMKNLVKILRELNPTRWVAYVDLKQFIKEFKALDMEPDFSTFMLEEVLKLDRNKLDAKVFKRLFLNGRVSIIFDGFDEIAPNCAEIVRELARALEFYGGNQLWIATRDYFEVDLRKKIHIDIACKLEEFTEEDGVNLIVKSWIFNDLTNTSEIKSKDAFENFVKDSPNLKNYKQKALQIVRKASMSENRSVGMPQLFKVIADGFKDDKDGALDLKGSEIYTKFVQNLYRRWSYEKGQIRNEQSVKSQEYELTFWKLHQFHAIRSLLPEFIEILFPGYDGSEWRDEEIIACGLMSKFDGEYYFLHETFREFFVADYVAKALKTLKFDKKFSIANVTNSIFKRNHLKNSVLKMFFKILTHREFKVIRCFLDDLIVENSITEKIQPKTSKRIEQLFLEELELTFHKKGIIFVELFTQNLENLSDFIITVLKTGNYKKVKRILFQNARNIFYNTKSSKMIWKFQEFLFEFLKIDDLEDLIMNQEILQRIIASGHDIEIFEDFVVKTEAKTDGVFVREILKVMSYGKLNEGNIFYLLCEFPSLNAHNVRKCLHIMQKFLTISEIFELMEKCNKNRENILQVCIQTGNIENFITFLNEVEELFGVQNSSQNFKKFIKQRNFCGQAVLNYSVHVQNFEAYNTFWTIVQKAFKNLEEVNEIVLQMDEFGNNFFHNLVLYNENPSIIELIFKIFKKNFSDAQFHKCLHSRGHREMNLLQLAAYDSKSIDVYKILWDVFKDSYTHEAFLEILQENNILGSNLFHVAVERSPNEIFDFMINGLEEIASNDEIKILLSSLGERRQNLIQSASCSKHFNVYLNLWKTFRKYFEDSEILEFIRHSDESGYNLLALVDHWSSNKIRLFTRNEIESFINHDE